MASFMIKDGVAIIPEGTEEIYSNAFYNCKRLTKVILPESVTTISESAFSGCKR
jgi:hypothetical protein